jgi:hypothetical protein
MIQPHPNLSREATEEFRAHYEDEFGVVLSDEEIREIAFQLLTLFGILVKGHPPKDQK